MKRTSIQTKNPDPAAGVEIITPVRVLRKAARRGLPFRDRSNLMKGLTLAFAFAFLLIGGLWLWHYLAGRSATQPQATTPPIEEGQAVPKITAAQPAAEAEKTPEPTAAAAEKEQAAQKPAEFMQLMEKGAVHEKEGNAALALSDYQQALRLDPESKEAQQGLARVKRLVSDQEFQQLLSEALAELHANKYTLAREKLLKAQALRPASQEVKDALAQADQSIHLAGIETHRRRATVAEQTEDWQQALDAYLQILKIDPNVRFASQGKQRALDHIRIDKRIDFFLQQPAALESDRQLENAVQLTAEIEKIDPRGPRLKDRLAKLTQMVDAAQTPVKIILESDGLTEVAVYKVGKLGRFTSRELSLRPGTYTVVGTRDGYQDVRSQLTIKAGQNPARIAIQCKTEI